MHLRVPCRSARGRLVLLAGAGLAGAALSAVSPAWPASAALAPTCVTAGVTVTCTFAYATGGYAWTVPAGITTVAVTADGGSGATPVGEGVLGVPP